MAPKRSVYIGFDANEATAFWTAVSSIKRRLTKYIPVNSVEIDDLRIRGLYTRPTEIRCGKLYDVISRHGMATEFANARFLVPFLAETGWALFADCDILCLCDLNGLFDKADPRYAVMCVKHDYKPEATTKMDGQVQSQYNRKNWSSVVLFNLEHPSNRRLTIAEVNNKTGKWLHGFSWLADQEIGALDPSYNYLVGHSTDANPKIIHWTEGGPWHDNYKNVEYASLWRAEQRLAARLCSI